MPEQELNPAAAKFISSLVKSLQILCNGQVEFNECIELVGHINVRVDKLYKFDYIVDEQVSRESNDSSTTFHSNSYHSSPPPKPSSLGPSSSSSELRGLAVSSPQHEITDCFEQNIPHHGGTMLPETNFNSHHHQHHHQHRQRSSRKSDNMMIKLEGNGDQDDCMVLPASPGDYEAVNSMNAQDNLSVAGPSTSLAESYDTDYDGSVKQYNQQDKKRKMHDHESSELGEASSTAPASQDALAQILQDFKPDIPVNCLTKLSDIEMHNDTNTSCGPIAAHGEIPDEEKLEEKDSILKPLDINQSVNDLKQNIARLTSLLDMHQVAPCEFGEDDDSSVSSLSHIKALKRKFLQSIDKEKVKKIKELLKGKRGKRKKQELRAIIAESGISEAQLKSIANETSLVRKCTMQREQRKAYKLRTQERQQKLLEMAEMLKRNQQQSESGVSIVSKLGNKKVTLHKSSISIVSHQTLQLTPETIDVAVDALTGKKKRPNTKGLDKMHDTKPVDSSHKRQNLKRKMKQIVSKLLRDINDCGYRVNFTSTIGSDAGSHNAELSVIPIYVDDVLPEVKDDSRPEMSEDEYAKHLEREHLLEKQKVNEEKMKEMEIRLTHILTGVEEIIIPSRKRYGPGDAQPTDAELMKQYRRKLKEDPEKYQEYKQKRTLRTRKRRLSLLATKMKEKASVAAAAAASIATTIVNEDNHAAQSMTLSQTVGSVNIHCPQVFGHPSSHQPSVSGVNVHHSGQYVGQVGVGAMHSGHQHQQPLSYSNEMDIVELIAASHNVQGQHFG